VIYCQKEDLSHKEALTQMIERYVDKKYLDFAYSTTSGDDSRHGRNNDRSL
jgi:hypothetical protein